MSQARKTLEAMRANPRGDWRIEDVTSVCAAFAVRCSKPSGGSHYGVSDPALPEILTVPFARPIKPIYIRRLVDFIDAVLAHRAAAEGEDDATV